jgi:hypothetical protein
MVATLPSSQAAKSVRAVRGAGRGLAREVAEQRGQDEQEGHAADGVPDQFCGGGERFGQGAVDDHELVGEQRLHTTLARACTAAGADALAAAAWW